MDRMSFTSGANSSLVYVADKPAPPIVALLQGRRLYYQRGLVVEWNNEHSQCAIHSIETGRALAPAPHFDYARFPHIRLHLGAVVRFDAVLDTNHIWIATVTAVEESPLYGVDGLDAYKGIYPSNPAPARLECTVLALVVRSCTSAPPCARPHSVRLWNSLIGDISVANPLKAGLGFMDLVKVHVVYEKSRRLINEEPCWVTETIAMFIAPFPANFMHHYVGEVLAAGGGLRTTDGWEMRERSVLLARLYKPPGVRGSPYVMVNSCVFCCGFWDDISAIAVIPCRVTYFERFDGLVTVFMVSRFREDGSCLFAHHPIFI